MVKGYEHLEGTLMEITSKLGYSPGRKVVLHADLPKTVSNLVKKVEQGYIANFITIPFEETGPGISSGSYYLILMKKRNNKN